jgi:hypothetical protein
MKITIPVSILQETEAEAFKFLRSLRKVDPADLDTCSEIPISTLSDADMTEIREIAERKGAGKFLRAFEAVVSARNGACDLKVPSFEAFLPLLSEHLRQNKRDGWIYELCADGTLLPWAVTGLRRRSDRSDRGEAPYVELTGTGFGPMDKLLRVRTKVWHFQPTDVSRRSVSTILEARGLYTETEALRLAHDQGAIRFAEVLRDGFAAQFRATGPFHILTGHERRNPHDVIGSRVIMDIDPDRIRTCPPEVETQVFGTPSSPCFVEMPQHPVVEVYSLETHEAFWINVSNLAPYVYRPELREKLILPQVQRDLLDVLTTDTDVLTGDLVEGKAAGNVILTKGMPGVGKTLTAEIYAEVCARPLYSVHAGNLGTSPREVAEQLRAVFQRAKRWGCVLLLDEADVFVMTRGRDVVQNAIVAEFLRTMEYFDGLLFMTTNRGDDIDEAILSRCAAIIHYDPPGTDLLPQVWRVMSENFDAGLDAQLIAELVYLFPQITPRDVKMLLRLTMRVARSRGEPLSADLFRRNAMFRGINAKVCEK